MVRFAESSDRQIELRAHLAIDALAPLTDLCAWGAFGNDLARIEIIPWLDGTFDVALDGELLHWMRREGGFPNADTVVAAVRARLAGGGAS